jgi:putative endonuclease
MREKGDHYEKLAADWLRKQGLQLLERNYHCRRGEIDLILLDGDCLCFVEVKYRASRRFGGVNHSIGAAKQQKLLIAAEHYLGRHPEHRQRPQRIDALLLQQSGGAIEVEWIRNAVQHPGY